MIAQRNKRESGHMPHNRYYHLQRQKQPKVVVILTREIDTILVISFTVIRIAVHT